MGFGISWETGTGQSSGDQDRRPQEVGYGDHTSRALVFLEQWSSRSGCQVSKLEATTMVLAFLGTPCKVYDRGRGTSQTGGGASCGCGATECCCPEWNDFGWCGNGDSAAQQGVSYGVQYFWLGRSRPSRSSTGIWKWHGKEDRNLVANPDKGGSKLPTAMGQLRTSIRRFSTYMGLPRPDPQWKGLGGLRHTPLSGAGEVRLSTKNQMVQAQFEVLLEMVWTTHRTGAVPTYWGQHPGICAKRIDLLERNWTGTSG